MSSPFRHLLGLIKYQLQKRPRLYLFGFISLLGMVMVGCSQGSYPLDFFYEMHYQQSYRSYEPPRLSSPAGAVPWFPSPAATSTASGERLFQVNCSMCHGPGAKGDGPVLKKMKESYGYAEKAPTNLTLFPVAFIEQVAGFTPQPDRPLFFGEGSVMPPFGKLLSPEERQLIAEYIATLPK